MSTWNPLEAPKAESHDYKWMANPVNDSLETTWLGLKSLSFSGLNIIPSSVAAIVFAVVLLALAMLWPYGFIPVIAALIWSFVRHFLEEMSQTETAIAKMPFLVSAGIFMAFWIPFALLCIPAVVVGWLAYVVEKVRE